MKFQPIQDRQADFPEPVHACNAIRGECGKSSSAFSCGGSGSALNSSRTIRAGEIRQASILSASVSKNRRARPFRGRKTPLGLPTGAEPSRLPRPISAPLQARPCIACT